MRAIEYDGWWHFQNPSSIERDLRKKEMCKEKGIDLLNISYMEYEKASKEEKLLILEKIKKFLLK